MLPNPGVHSSSTYANLSLVEKNMKTQCLSLHIVTIYPLVLKRTKKKSKQQQTITIVATVTVAFTSIFSATSNCIMQKINQASYVMIVWIKNIEADSSFSSFNFLAVVEKSKTNEEKMAYKNGNT